MAASNGTLKSQSSDVAILMVPFPMQGHLNQLLHLARLLAPAAIPIHFATAATHNRLALHRIQGWNPLSVPNIVFHHLPSLHFQSPNPDPNSSSNFPSHLQPMFDASSALRRPITDLTASLCRTNRRVVIIYDSLTGNVVQDLVDYANVEGYMFHSVSAYAMFFFLWEKLGKPFELRPKILEGLPSLEGCFTPEFTEFMRSQHGHRSLYSGRIYNTSKVLEHEFLDLLARPEINGDKKQWALGPFNPVHPLTSTACNGNSSHHYCLEWLHKQPPNSVIFVSFGTSTTLPNNQIQELAVGLENSRQRFIWVARAADTGDGEIGGIELPLGFEERVKERGIIVRDWAPQLSILGHSSTGGFMSHCGWNSSIESISMGVPIAAWPMHSDQPRNAVLINKVLKIGVVVREWERRREVVKAEEVEGIVRRLMATEEGAAMRKRAEMVGARVRKEMGDGGVTHLELGSFISHICR